MNEDEMMSELAAQDEAEREAPVTRAEFDALRADVRTLARWCAALHDMNGGPRDGLLPLRRIAEEP